MRATIETRLAKVEHRLFSRTSGVHRYNDDEQSDLIAWLRDPEPAREAWAVALFQREGLLP